MKASVLLTPWESVICLLSRLSGFHQSIISSGQLFYQANYWACVTLRDLGSTRRGSFVRVCLVLAGAGEEAVRQTLY